MSAQALALRGPIGFLLLPQFTLIALSSAIEPLRIANRYLPDKYRFRLLSLDGKPVPDGNGISIQVDGSIDDDLALGTLFLVSDIRPERFYSLRLRRWLHQLERAGCVLGGLDTGCFLLARAGLLGHHRVTLHWEVIDAFRERYPDIDVHATLFEIDRDRLSSAGGSASLDMMLHAIAIDHGITMANRVAEHCLHRSIRDGETGQRMPVPMRTGAHHPTLVKALGLIEAQQGNTLSVPDLARAVGISERQLLRLFKRHVGHSPSGYQLRHRLNQARALLLQTDLSITEIAEACGFQSLSHFSTVYRQHFGHTPSHTRGRSMASHLVLDAHR